MTQQRKTPMSAVSITTALRDDLTRLALETSVEVGKRVTMSALVAAMLTVARDHREDLISALRTPRKDTDE